MHPLSSIRRSLITRFGQWAGRFGFEEVETPILEQERLYASLQSDDVGKEIYRVSESDLVLRPEGTAGVVRAVRKGRVWYAGAMFRRERPQRGRYRQFTQLGVECFEDDVWSDVDVIQMAYEYLREVGWKGGLRLNTLGSSDDRARYNDVLKEYLSNYYEELSEISQRRVDMGRCMRVLDSKHGRDREIVAEAPRLSSFINADESRRFEQLQRALEEADVDFHIDERIVRGLDYYTSTAFEFDGAHKALCGGGRYTLSGRDGVGFAIGLDRMEEVCELEAENCGKCFIIGLDGAESSSGVLARRGAMALRRQGYEVEVHYESARRGLQRAFENNGRVFAAIGEREASLQSVNVKFVGQSGCNKGEMVEVNDLTAFVNRHWKGLE